MKITVGEYFIETDEKNFIVSKETIIKESRLTKEENVGKVKMVVVGYFTTVEGCIKAMGNDVLLSNNDLVQIMDKLKDIKKDTAKIVNILEGEM